MVELDTLVDENLALEQLVAENEALEADLAAERKLAFNKFAQEVENKLLDLSTQRANKENEMLENMRLFLGETGHMRATADNPFPREDNAPKLNTGFNIVRTKCEIAIASGLSMQTSGGERNWDLTIDPDAQDPKAALMQCEAMERVIESQLTECRYAKELNLLQRDKTILGTCVVKGPLHSTKIKKRHSVAQTSDGSTVAVPSFVTDRTPSVKRVNPWFFFPDDSVLDFANSEYTLEIHPYSATDLRNLVLATDSGFDSVAIKEILRDGVRDEFNGRKFYDFGQLAGNTFALKNKFCVIEYHGPCHIDDLGSYGITELPYDTPNEIYYVEAWICQGQVLYFQLSGIEGANRPPYAVDVWETDPSHIFGIGMPKRMGVHQRVINSAYAILLDNISNGSGPQVIVDREAIEPSTPNDWSLRPNKVWYHRSLGATKVQDAIYFFTVPIVSKEVRDVLEMARGFGEEESGIPNLIAGLGAPTIAEGMGQQSIMMQAATVGLEQKNQEFDENINDPVIHWFIEWNMQYGNRPELIGNYSVDVRTSSEYRSKQIRIRDMEKLSMEISQNPQMAEWVNMDELIASRFALMQLPSKAIIKSQEEVDEARANQPPDPGAAELEIAQRKVAVDEGRLEIEREKLGQEASLQQQRELWEHEEKMSANAARFSESEAAVLKAANEREIEFLRLAQKDESNKAQIMAMLQRENITDGTKKFLAGLDHSREARKLLLQQEELAVARKNGQGALSTI